VTRITEKIIGLPWALRVNDRLLRTRELHKLDLIAC
jgi:hypothetical protein